MSDIAINVENLSKRYRIGLKETQAETLAGALTGWLKLPFQNYRSLRRLSHFSEDGHDRDDVLWALKDVSFEVKHGEVIGIIGHNGAGKSTLLKILSRITEPASGRIMINGRVASLLEVGTGFHPDLTGRENVYLNGTILGMTKKEIDRKFDEIVDFSGVEKFIDTPVKRYSSGMKVRLAFSVAAYLEPEILLVDEVLAVGDASFQKKSIGKMQEVGQQGRTVLFVSHQLTMIQSLCSRVLMLHNGCLIRDGTSEKVIGEYFRQIDSGNNDHYDLSSVLRDGGSGELQFRYWYIQDQELRKGRRIGCGESCEFKLQYDASNLTVKPRNVSVALVIKDYLDQPLLTGWTKLLQTDFEEVPLTGTFVCRFEHMPLVPGTYKLHLWSAVNGQMTDCITNAGTFEIEPSDTLGTGLLPNPKFHGHFIMKDYHWSIEQAE